MALTHNSKLSPNEPDWAKVDKTKLPSNAFAGELDRSYPHHWVENGVIGGEGRFVAGDMFLHRGGLNAAWADANGARSGQQAGADIKAHLEEHRKAIGEVSSESSVHAARPEKCVTGVAYSGGPMKLPGWKLPVVVDLSGLEVPESVPLLANHENRTGSRVGVVQPHVKSNELHVNGEILSTSGVAGGIVEQAQTGADWQLSIGADVLDSELVPGQRLVNGQMQQGPFFHVKKAVLREVSVVAVGADDGTHMRLAASFVLYARMDFSQGGEEMEFEKWLEAKGVDSKTLDDERRSQLKGEFDKENEQPRSEVTAAGGPKPPKAPASPGKRHDPVKPAPAKPSPAPAPQPPSDPQDPATAPAQPNPVPEGGTPPKARVEAERAVKAERDRIAAIQEICAGEYPEIEREAIKAGWDREQASQKVLKAMRSDRPRRTRTSPPTATGAAGMT